MDDAEGKHTHRQMLPAVYLSSVLGKDTITFEHNPERVHDIQVSNYEKLG